MKGRLSYSEWKRLWGIGRKPRKARRVSAIDIQRKVQQQTINKYLLWAALILFGSPVISAIIQGTIGLHIHPKYIMALLVLIIIAIAVWLRTRKHGVR